MRRLSFSKSLNYSSQWLLNLSATRGDIALEVCKLSNFIIFSQDRTQTFSQHCYFSTRVSFPYLKAQPSNIRNLATEPFFEATEGFVGKTTLSTLSFLRNKTVLRNVLQQLGAYASGNYLCDHFINWLSDYAVTKPACLEEYLLGVKELDHVCNDFIKFCFKKNISLDKDSTLQSFERHNAISDMAVKNELAKIKPKKIINLLGFGLGDGGYEKVLAQHLIQKEIAKEVKIFGFDPYAEKGDDLELLTTQQLLNDKTLTFDLITARWVLHHVNLPERWTDFINCINRCNSQGLVLIVEHGFLKKQPSLINSKCYAFLNATFDVIANIGIRPDWFTKTTDVGSNFFISYLEPKDFETIKKRVSFITTQHIYEVGPDFPNQTICSMRVDHQGQACFNY